MNDYTAIPKGWAFLIVYGNDKLRHLSVANEPSQSLFAPESGGGPFIGGTGEAQELLATANAAEARQKRDKRYPPRHPRTLAFPYATRATMRALQRSHRLLLSAMGDHEARQS